jgi:hypothetical protein
MCCSRCSACGIEFGGYRCRHRLGSTWSLWARAGVLALTALTACSGTRQPSQAPKPVRPSGTVATEGDTLAGVPSQNASQDGRPQDPEEAPRPNAEILRTPNFRDALQDVTRIGLVTGFREVRYGLLHLELGTFDSSTPLEYYLARLHLGYRESTGFHGEAVLELWQKGRKLGEFTNDGLLLGPEYSRPR